MKVLVITPTLGNSPWLDGCAASVAAHAGEHLHMLVAPSEKVAELRRRFTSAVVVPEPTTAQGMYAAINVGLAATTGWDAFSYLNDDDLLLPSFAEVVNAIQRFSEARSPAIVYGRVRLVDRDGKRIGAIPISPAPELNRALYAQRLEPVYQHGTLVTRAVVEALGGFDESLRFCGDSEFLARACVSGIPFVRATMHEVAAFRLRAGQLTKDRAAMTAERARVDEKLGLLTSEKNLALRWARSRFRLANFDVYAERIWRHGWRSFDELLAGVQ
jgi:hypothetical protein